METQHTLERPPSCETAIIGLQLSPYIRGLTADFKYECNFHPLTDMIHTSSEVHTCTHCSTTTLHTCIIISCCTTDCKILLLVSVRRLKVKVPLLGTKTMTVLKKVHCFYITHTVISHCRLPSNILWSLACEKEGSSSSDL